MLGVLLAVAVAAALIEDVDDGHHDMLGYLLLLLRFCGQPEVLHAVEGQLVEGVEVGGAVEAAQGVEERLMLA